MPKVPAASEQIDRIRAICSTLDELREETWRLCESVTAEARKAREAAAGKAPIKSKTFRLKR
jgi:hypothetical protein